MFKQVIQICNTFDVHQIYVTPEDDEIGCIFTSFLNAQKAKEEIEKIGFECVLTQEEDLTILEISKYTNTLN
jgi:hypothetical protein